jgi:hypothetical protein
MKWLNVATEMLLPEVNEHTGCAVLRDSPAVYSGNEWPPVVQSPNIKMDYVVASFINTKHCQARDSADSLCYPL